MAMFLELKIKKLAALTRVHSFFLQGCPDFCKNHSKCNLLPSKTSGKTPSTILLQCSTLMYDFS